MIEEKQNSNIRVGRQAGFCFGVRRAAEALENRIEISATGERIYTLGKLIHNDSYLRFLEAKGVRVIGEGEILTIASSATEKNPVTVLIRAHGISKTAEQTLNYAAESNRYFKFIDCTCPYVKKIHKIAAENSGDGICFVLMGSKNHPEVIGIMSCLNGEGHVFSSADEFERAADEGALGDLHKKKTLFGGANHF